MSSENTGILSFPVFAVTHNGGDHSFSVIPSLQEREPSFFEKKVAALEKDMLVYNEKKRAFNEEHAEISKRQRIVDNEHNQKYSITEEAKAQYVTDYFRERAAELNVSVHHFMDNISEYPGDGPSNAISYNPDVLKVAEGKNICILTHHVWEVIKHKKRAQWNERIRANHPFCVRALEVAKLILAHPASRKNINFRQSFAKVRVATFSLPPDLLAEAKKYQDFFRFCNDNTWRPKMVYNKTTNQFEYDLKNVV